MLAGLMWLGVGRSLAQEAKPSSVVIARVAGDESIVLRLRAELSTYRFRVIELRRAGALSELAEEREAQAALRAKPEAMAIELWVRASGSGRTSQELVSAGPGRNPEVLALRVTEAMRARGLTLPPLTAPGPKTAIAADSVKTSAADGGRRARADGGTPDPEADDPGVAEPTPPSAAAVLSPASKEPEAARTSTSAEAPKPPARTSADATPERKSAEPPAKRKAEEPASERTRADTPAERKPAEPVKVKPAEPAAETDPSEPEPTSEVTTEAEHAEPEPENTLDLSLRDALLYAEVGPTGVWSPGANQLGPALDALISLRFRPNQSSSISLVGLIPLLSTDAHRPDGASIEVQTFGIGGFGDLHTPLGRVELSAGLGAMALLSSVMVFSTEPAYQSSYQTQRLAALLGRVGASVAITRELRVSGSIIAGLTVNPLRIELPRSPGDQTSDPDVTWGKPLLLGTLSLELALPWYR